jgi:type VI secretion system secreted protein Hcp
MAVDAYLYFMPYTGGKAIQFESQLTLQSDSLSDPLGQNLTTYSAKSGPANLSTLCEVTDYSFDIEQVLNIGSQSRGAGAGKVTFNPFSITRKIDAASPIMFANCCAGQPFQFVSLFLRKSAGGGTASGTANAGVTFVRFDFKLVAIKTIAWAHDDESPTETITFEYGALQVNYAVQKENGQMLPQPAMGWNRVTNTQDNSDFTSSTINQNK